MYFVFNKSWGGYGTQIWLPVSRPALCCGFSVPEHIPGSGTEWACFCPGRPGLGLDPTPGSASWENVVKMEYPPSSDSKFSGCHHNKKSFLNPCDLFRPAPSLWVSPACWDTSVSLRDTVLLFKSTQGCEWWSFCSLVSAGRRYVHISSEGL